MAVEFEAVCGPKFMSFWDYVGHPLQLSTHLTDCLHPVLFRRHRPLKFALGCEVGPKRWFLGPDLQGEGIFQISDMHFQIILTSDHVVKYGLVPSSDLGDQLTKKRKKEEETLVKYKSADILCRAAQLIDYMLLLVVTFGTQAGDSYCHSQCSEKMSS